MNAFSWPCIDRSEGKAPIATSDNNVYVAWWGNKTGNYEVMFKASNDGGQTFGDKISLSNSTNGTSVEADVTAFGDNVYVTYADNKTGNADAFIRASNDNGETFGPEFKLTNNSDSNLAYSSLSQQMKSDDIVIEKTIVLYEIEEMVNATLQCYSQLNINMDACCDNKGVGVTI